MENGARSVMIILTMLMLMLSAGSLAIHLVEKLHLFTVIIIIMLYFKVLLEALHTMVQVLVL